MGLEMRDNPLVTLVKKKTAELSYIRDEEFVLFMKKYKFNMFRLAKSVLHNDADAEDAVGETILKAFQNLRSLRSIESMKPWIMKILFNESCSMARRMSRMDLVEDMEKHAGSTSDERNELWTFVAALEEEYRSVVILFYYEDMSIRDICEVLGLPSGTVKARLSRARKKLKSILENEGGGFNE
jgi:RNA polymerase sigma-70 factor (ECF subfamily)